MMVVNSLCQKQINHLEYSLNRPQSYFSGHLYEYVWILHIFLIWPGWRSREEDSMDIFTEHILIKDTSKRNSYNVFMLVCEDLFYFMLSNIYFCQYNSVIVWKIQIWLMDIWAKLCATFVIVDMIDTSHCAAMSGLLNLLGWHGQ